MPRAPANPYTMAEKRRILQFIIEHDAYYLVKGNSLWIKMQSKFRNTHSWQSLKEHYKKRLVPSLASADFKLTEAQITNFRRGFGGILNVKRKEQRELSSPVSFYKLWSDEEDDAPLAGPSKTKNNKSKEVLNDKPVPNTSSSSCTSHKEKIPVSKTKNSSQLLVAESTSTIKPIVCFNDSSEDEHKKVDSQTLSCDVDSDETNVDSDECSQTLSCDVDSDGTNVDSDKCSDDSCVLE